MMSHNTVGTYPNLLRVSMPRSSLPNNYYLILGRVSSAIVLSIVEKIFDSLQDNAVLSVSNNGKKVSSPISSFFQFCCKSFRACAFFTFLP